MQQGLPTTTLKPLLILLVLFVFIASFIKSQLSSITPLSTAAPESLFSSERAFNMLQQLTFEQIPHPVDSLANRVVEQRLVSLLRGMGYQEEIQDSEICRDSERGFARCTRVRNIIVHIEGREEGKGILLSAHYDSVGAGPGGSDAGAAVGTLLETARLLSLAEQPRNSIILLFNEGEEFGLFGAKAFMEQHPLAKKLQLALNVEARGSSGKSVLFETGEDSGWLVKHYAQTAKAPLSSSLFYEVYRFLPNDTDLTIFKDHGLQGLNFAHAERLPHYHTPLDNLENLDRGSLQHHGDNVWGVLSNIKNVDLGEVEKGNLVYTDVMGLFVISWSESTSVAVSGILVLLLMFVIALLSKQQHLSTKQVLLGLLSTVIILVVSVLVAMGIKLITQTISGSNYPWYSNQLPMQLALWSGVALFGLFIGRMFARGASSINMLLAVSVFWTLLSVISSILMPGISFLFILPAIAGVASLFILVWLIGADLPEQSKVTIHTLVLIISACICAISFMPIAYVLEIMIGYQMSEAVGMVLGFVVISLLPVLTMNSSAADGFKKLLYSVSVLMLCGVGWTSLQATYTEWMPQHLNLQYLQNPKGEAFILKGHQRNQPSDELLSALSGEGELTTIFPWSAWIYHSTKVDSELFEPAIAEIRELASNEYAKKVQLNLSAFAKNLSDLVIYVPIDSSLQSIETNSDSLEYKGEKRAGGYYQYHCRGVSCAETQLILNFSEEKPTKILIASIYPGLPFTFRELYTYRGKKAVPHQNGDQSIVYTELDL
ncbi:MAG: hypothetical protein ACI8UG_002254 [Gammaproteobacteria bacterium]|jgi:hypothetical protein